MSRRGLFDTSILIDHWNRRSHPVVRRWTAKDARAWARELSSLRQTRATVTPAALEFLCGATTERELELYLEYLKGFELIDRGNITISDWNEAERIAKRIPRKPRRRQLGDCLIRAIANRLKYDVISTDNYFPG